MMMEKLRWRAFLTLTGETYTDRKNAIIREFENYFETLRETGVDCKAVVLLDPVRGIRPGKRPQPMNPTPPNLTPETIGEI
jgi:hypothetical protein